MFENVAIESLQVYWWIIVSLLGACLVLLMLVQGGQSLLRVVARTDEERSLVVNTIGRKWELTFTTLVTFGGAFFASFPLFYSTSFGGAYWVWMVLLFSFIIQAVSFEFRTKAGNFLGQRVYETFLIVNGVVAPLVVGVAVGTFFTGSLFSVNELNLSRWMHPAHGLEALLNTTNLSLGVTVFLLSRLLGAMYLINALDSKEIATAARQRVKKESLPFVLLAVFFLVKICTLEGFAVSDNGVVFQESYKYFNNFMEMPVVLAMLLGGVILILAGVFVTVFMKKDHAIWFAGTGTVLLVLSLFFVVGFNHTAYYPSTFNIQQSLTIHNSSSSHYTLVAMSYVSLFVPFVACYIWLVWRAMNKTKVTKDEIASDSHSY